MNYKEKFRAKAQWFWCLGAVEKVYHLPLTLRSGYSSSVRRRKLRYRLSKLSPPFKGGVSSASWRMTGW
jgi:hypothetical protein